MRFHSEHLSPRASASRAVFPLVLMIGIVTRCALGAPAMTGHASPPPPPSHTTASSNVASRSNAASTSHAASTVHAGTASAAPYRSLEVRVRTRDGFTLAGTLTLPRAVRRPPVVLVISGASVQDRDASSPHGPYRPFRQIADTLSRNGISVLRLDDRGAGKSTGRIDTLNTAERANDSRDAIEFLRARPDLDASRIALLGHSEGALIATMIAASDTSIRGLILMASTCATGRTIVEWQRTLSVQGAPATRGLQRRILREAMDEWDRRVQTDRWAAFFDTYSPDTTASKVKTPVLILQGDADTEVPTSEADALAGKFREAGNHSVTVRHLARLDHAFLDVGNFPDGVAANDHAFLLGSALLGAIAAWAVPRLH
ncbi:MAG: alpha/beta fold hydrolase [Candidatus Eisenbacteria bacterium]|nr:alpha/beta fold hydrolase [Candidatus Eisenbacteria bacterium]